MNKKRLGLSLGLLACAGFFLIILQYKVTELSLKVPPIEENYHQLKQQLEGLELQVRSLKNPKRLFEQKEKHPRKTTLFRRVCYNDSNIRRIY